MTRSHRYRGYAKTARETIIAAHTLWTRSAMMKR